MQTNPWAIEPGQGVGDWRLGASREDVVRRLSERGVPFETEPEEDDDILFLDDLETELKFDRFERLFEIVADSERLTLSGHAVIGARIDQVVDRLRASDSETLWTPEAIHDAEQKAENQQAVSTGQPSDEQLIKGGTLWVPRLGLGLDLWRGEILCVRLRQPSDVPRDGVGSLTQAQRALLAKPDLSDVLDEADDSTPKRPRSRLQQLLTLAMLASLGWVVWTAIQYQQKWNAAPTVEGEVVAVNPPPPDPFPSEITVAYLVDGKEYRTVFGLNDVYMTRAVGDKVEVRYLPDAPDEPMGPARVSDAAFVEFMPWGIGVVGAYLVLQLLISIAGALLRAASGPAELKTTIGKQYD